MANSNILYKTWKIEVGASFSSDDTSSQLGVIETDFMTLCAIFIPPTLTGDSLSFIGFDDVADPTKWTNGFITDSNGTLMTAKKPSNVLTAYTNTYAIALPPAAFFGFNKIAIATNLQQAGSRCYIKAAFRPC